VTLCPRPELGPGHEKNGDVGVYRQPGRLEAASARHGELGVEPPLHHDLRPALRSANDEHSVRARARGLMPLERTAHPSSANRETVLLPARIEIVHWDGEFA